MYVYTICVTIKVVPTSFLTTFSQAWDAGHGFKMKTAYASGYIVMALSLVSAIGLTLYTPSL